MSELRWHNVHALPLIHGRLPFAIEARRRLLSERFDHLAVELPPSLVPDVHRGLDALPRVSIVAYRERPRFLGGDGDDQLWYVPIDPADGIIEALRIARGERTPISFVDAEIEDFAAPRIGLPDPLAIGGLGLERWHQVVLPLLRVFPHSEQDAVREAHMAARITALSERLGPDRRLLFVCGLAHWHRIRDRLHRRDLGLHAGQGPAPELIETHPVAPRSMAHVLGEMPFLAAEWEAHRSGIDLEAYDPTDGLKRLLLAGRDAYEAAFPDALERADTARLATMLRYLRKLCVRDGRLMPDTYALTVAARGTVGNDFAVTLLETANTYAPNEAETDDALEMTESRARLDDGPATATSRTPGTARETRSLTLIRRPTRKNADRWRHGWNPLASCSWPPEDLVIENFREYVSRRALTMAGLDRHRTEPFTTSLKDGIALRETMRDWHRGRLHVKEEPRVTGDIGALVVIFEEDDDGTKFPWRVTWHAEHPGESTLAFYATDPKADMVGPGIGRMFYGGCMFLFPPRGIPEIWDDLRFEQARRPSERLLLAALWWSHDRFIAHLGPTPPSPEVQAQAQALGRHVVHLPLGSFSPGTLERMRRAHVLNGQQARSWADRFIG